MMIRNLNTKANPHPISSLQLEPGARYLVLTVDCEIFGNGTGDVRQHVLQPMQRMATLGEQFGVPMTFFFEVEEYLAFERYAEPLRASLGYDPAHLLREQVISLVRRGHDVQLHLHPQWYGAHYHNGRWLLHDDKATVDALFADQEQVTQYIRERKSILESILREADPRREVQAYRAGGFCAQPGKKLLTALAANGILIDSSVVKGLYQQETYTCTDYRGAPAARKLWRVTADVCIEDPSGLVVEIPIHSVMGHRLGQMSWHRIRAKFSSHVPKERQKEMVRELGVRWQPLQLLKFLWQEVPIKLDFHNLSARKLMKLIRMAKPVQGHDDLDVLVLLGHTKEHIHDKTLSRLLERISTESDLQVITFDQLTKATLTETKNNFS